MTIALGQPVPDFSVVCRGNNPVMSLSKLAGRKVVLYFYPKDATPGCTLEGQQFRDLYAQFQALGCDIFGVSRDTLKLHEKFRSNECFPFELLSDGD